MKRVLSALCAAALLSACATVAPRTPQQVAYTLESEYAAALAIGAAYNDLPRCPSARNGLCSDPAKIALLRQTVKVATVALNDVEIASRTKGDLVSTLLAASAIVDSLQKLTADLKVK